MKSEVEVSTKGPYVSTPVGNLIIVPAVKSSGPAKRVWWATAIRLARCRIVRYPLAVTNIVSAGALIFYFPDLLGTHTIFVAVWLVLMSALEVVNAITDLIKWMLEDLAKLFRQELVPFVIRCTRKLDRVSNKASDLLK